MEERVEISILVDIYGTLLTDKQRDIMTMYYNEDLSLAEISEINNTSRQAIHDIIKRCHKLLVEYEEKLGLMSKNIALEHTKERVLKKMEELKNNQSYEADIMIIEDIKKDIIENI